MFYTRDHKIQAFHTKLVLTLGQGRRIQIKLESTFQGSIDAMNSKNAGGAWFLQFDFFWLTLKNCLVSQANRKQKIQ